MTNRRMGLMESYTTTIMGAGINEMSDIIEVEAETNNDLVGAPRIMVVGAGGAGNNSVSLLSHMGIKGAEIIAVNTDLQALKLAEANKRILIGKNITRGRGAGGDPETARRRQGRAL